MNCDELFLNEVCHVELVAAANCNLTVPANADPQTEMEGMLTMQLVTALPSVDERLRLLRRAGLDYLEMNVLVVTDLLQNEDE